MILSTDLIDGRRVCLTRGRPCDPMCLGCAGTFWPPPKGDPDDDLVTDRGRKA